MLSVSKVEVVVSLSPEIVASVARVEDAAEIVLRTQF